MNCLIVRYSEIGLKGKNRAHFERKLVSNIKDCLKKNKLTFEKIIRPQGRIIIYCGQPKKLAEHLKRVFGIKTISPAHETAVELEEIKKAALEQVTETGISSKNSFRVTARRIDKTAKYSSNELNITIGDLINTRTNAKVNLTEYDYEFGIELFSGKAYVFTQKSKGLGGLPVGVEGKVAVLIDGKASLLAALLVMKRGCSIIPVTTGVKKDIKLLQNYSYGYDVKLQKIKSLTKSEIYKLKPTPLALVVSQTLKNFRQLPTEKEVLVLRPLVGYDEKGILKQLQLFTLAE